MKSNQSLHITIKQPPNPEPIRTIGIFSDLDNPELPQMIVMLLKGIPFEPKDRVFHENLRDEVLKLLSMNSEVLAVERKGNITSIHMLTSGGLPRLT